MARKSRKTKALDRPRRLMESDPALKKVVDELSELAAQLKPERRELRVPYVNAPRIGERPWK